MSDVWKLYETHATEFDRDRGRTLSERYYLDQLAQNLTPASDILDLGCGTGDPIGRHLLESGFRLTGVDAAPAMIRICRERFSAGTWLEADMRTLDLHRQFGAIVAWDSFFHLNHEKQRGMFPVFRKHLAPRGRLLFTSGPTHGEAIGSFYGHALFHASLAPDEYRQLLTQNGLEVIEHRIEDPDCGHHTVWLCQASA